MATVEERVASGAYMLDVHFGPEWRDDIDLGKLDTRSCENCVVGQVYGKYERGLFEIGIFGNRSTAMIQPEMLGFAINRDTVDADLMDEGVYYSAVAQDIAFTRLDEEWKRVLA